MSADRLTHTHTAINVPELVSPTGNIPVLILSYSRFNIVALVYLLFVCISKRGDYIISRHNIIIICKVWRTQSLENSKSLENSTFSAVKQNYDRLDYWSG